MSLCSLGNMSWVIPLHAAKSNQVESGISLDLSGWAIIFWVLFLLTYPSFIKGRWCSLLYRVLSYLVIRDMDVQTGRGFHFLVFLFFGVGVFSCTSWTIV